MIPVYVVEEYKQAIEDWIPVRADVIFERCEDYIDNRLCIPLVQKEALIGLLRIRTYVEDDPVFIRK